MQIIGWLGRWLGLVSEKLHHVEADAIALATRYENVAINAENRVNKLASQIASKDALMRDYQAVKDTADRKAAKIRDFFA